MKQIVTLAQMRAIEAHMIEAQGVPGLVLMEHAAAGAAQAVQKLLPPGGRALILCGGGNNGGDGLSLLRQLAFHGIRASALLLAPPDSLKGDALTEYRMAKGCGLTIREIGEGDEISLSDAGLIVDALFGTGLSRPVEGRFARAIQTINASGLPVVAIDIPSGVDAETGHILGDAVRANVTVTFQHKKPGHLLLPGRACAGETIVSPIGLTQLAVDAVEEWGEADVAQLLPPRPLDSHKGRSGRALLFAGSTNFSGAALLSAGSALRAGCGLLHVAVPRGIRTVFAACPGAICHPVGEGEEWDEDACAEALGIELQASVLALGPGMGAGAGIPRLLEHLLKTGKPIVIDADGLNALAANRKLLPLLHPHVILTPHPMEMARLTESPLERILSLPLPIAREAARQWNCTVILKGATSVIAGGTRTCLNTTGNPGLAKGGSGDVLTGIVTALLAQGLAPYEAACAGAYLLGSTADRAFSLLGMRMLMPTDVIDALGK